MDYKPAIKCKACIILATKLKKITALKKTKIGWSNNSKSIK
jgi:hypothetical protein